MQIGQIERLNNYCKKRSHGRVDGPLDAHPNAGSQGPSPRSTSKQRNNWPMKPFAQPTLGTSRSRTDQTKEIAIAQSQHEFSDGTTKRCAPPSHIKLCSPNRQTGDHIPRFSSGKKPFKFSRLTLCTHSWVHTPNGFSPIYRGTNSLHMWRAGPNRRACTAQLPLIRRRPLQARKRPPPRSPSTFQPPDGDPKRVHSLLWFLDGVCAKLHKGWEPG